MSTYHLRVNTLSRNQGRSVVAAAAYRSGEKLHDKYFGMTHDYTHKKGVVHTAILLPAGAPSEFLDRQTLWSAVDVAERRSDARTAREVVIALPNELILAEQIKLTKRFAMQSFVNRGMCADISIHDKGTGNPHAHILLTTRPIEHSGFSAKKNREWDKRWNVILWRELWAKAQNIMFKLKGIKTTVSHESYAVQGIDRIPTKHLGYKVWTLMKRGVETERSKEYYAIIEDRNKRREERSQEQYRQYKHGHFR